MSALVFGAGNLLLSDEGFGVHFIKYLDENYIFPEDVELYDGGTLGIMVTHLIEESDAVFLVDVIEAEGEPGKVFRFEKDEFLKGSLPVKMSPHQIGIQEVLMLSQLRGRSPEQITLFGVIPASYEAGVELSPVLQGVLPQMADNLVEEMRSKGYEIKTSKVEIKPSNE